MSEDQSYQYLREYSEKDKIWDTQKRISNNVEKTLYSFQNAVLSAESTAFWKEYNVFSTLLDILFCVSQILSFSEYSLRY